MTFRHRIVLAIRSRRGATTVEFAMVLVPLLTIIFGTMACAMWIWAWQVLAASAGDAARCAGINSTSCANVATSVTATQSYAISAAAARGLSGLTTSNVTVNTGATAKAACNNTTASVVEVVITYAAPWSGLIVGPGTITGKSCFPLTSS